MKTTARDFFSRRDEVDLHEECVFFSKLKMRNGTFKFTRPSRFRKLEKACAVFFRERSATLHEVLDLGVSTGITTLELKHFLSANGVKARIVATDLFIDAYIVDLAGGVEVLADPQGWPLRYAWRGRAFRSWTRRLDYLTLAAIPLAILRHILRPRMHKMIADGKSKPVQMITRSLAGEGEITFVENDVLARAADFRQRFDFVRAANILNLNYFSRADIDNAVGNIASYLRGPGALVLVTRTTTDAGQNAASLLEFGNDRKFHVLTRIGGGSEVEPHFLRFISEQV